MGRFNSRYKNDNRLVKITYDIRHNNNWWRSRWFNFCYLYGSIQSTVLLFDTGDGRSSYPQINENYLGFPDGVSARQLKELGTIQAKKFGVSIVNEHVKNIMKNETFNVSTSSTSYELKSIILATGVTDLFPHFKDWDEYVGHSLFWCITCDGYKTLNKKVVIIGHDDDTACTAMQFKMYTSDITIISNTETPKEKISEGWLQRLKTAHIPIVHGKISKVIGNNGMISSIEVNQESLLVDFIFNQQGATPNNSLALELGVKIDKHGYIVTDVEQRTNVPFVYAAGDVTKLFSHQVVTAAHEGSMAAEAANYDLYPPECRMD